MEDGQVFSQEILLLGMQIHMLINIYMDLCKLRFYFCGHRGEKIKY